MKYPVILAAALLAGTSMAWAAEPWQKIENPTAAQVARVWQAPPSE
jgi:hypothetical protein